MAGEMQAMKTELVGMQAKMQELGAQGDQVWEANSLHYSVNKTNMNKIFIINLVINNIGFRFCEPAFRLKQSSSLSRWQEVEQRRSGCRGLESE